MWQWRQSPGGAQQGPRGGGRSARLWFAVAGLLIVGYLVVQALGLLSPDGSANGTVGTPSDTTGYLAQGYAQLEQDAAATTSGSFWSLWVGMIIPLAIVLVAAYAILRGLRYLNTRVAAPISSGRVLESIDSLSLGAQGTVHLVRVGERVIVVGASGQQLSFLTELSPDDAAAVLAAHRAGGGADPLATRGVLQSFQGILAGRLAQPPSGDSTPGDVPVTTPPDTSSHQPAR